ncbi:phosphoglycolate phosphatase [Thiosulfatimonas sediminis]|uniref:Phosphoglycolate phosphatase n=1 Tax=Thiosulfatimonas sediminis TaxID=2675054 RepID=A0A6F8PV74_9GAMM|nr:HAD-IA family hydrolase [Thiosulfatimonas sediminis]BBP45996.1 phosphoglycolate phosphatase [Thiosulfatimonas sediminis]
MNPATSNTLQCILFDLDGTLLDTSYDFAFAMAETCRHFDQPIVTYQDLRSVVSQGGLAMTQRAFPTLSGAALEQRRLYFLDRYFENIAQHTQLFPGLQAGLEHLADKQIPWGIVTNKPGWLTEKLLGYFTFPSAPKTVISGDTLAVRKPHPEPMWLAAQECQIAPEHCLYLGDHPRDIEAGINAKMQTGAALFGYLPEGSTSADWPADWLFHTPFEISRFIKQHF